MVPFSQFAIFYLLYKCPEEHRFQAAGNERKKERIIIERMKERKKEREKERKKERTSDCRVFEKMVFVFGASLFCFIIR
jgi:hypothetical protein